MPTLYAKALYDFGGAQDSDLPFKENDIITVLEKDDSGWWTGELNGKRGEFPFNYVEVVSEDEAKRARPRAGTALSAKGGASESVSTVKVTGSRFSGRKILFFKIEYTSDERKWSKVEKSLAQIREFDKVLQSKTNTTHERLLPPAWSGNAKLGEKDTDKRQRSVENYLNKVATDSSTDNMLLGLFSGKIAGDESTTSRERIPQLAHVEFTWTPQDDVELYMQEGQMIEVLMQETGSAGWWKGKTVDGMTGLFPYNHVELLDDRVAIAIAEGTSLGRAQEVQYNEPSVTNRKSARNSMARISLGLFGGGGKDKEKAAASSAAESKKTAKPNIKARQKKAVYPFTMSSTDAFDRLIDAGFSIEENGVLVSMTPPRDAPKDGDAVQLSYCAYVWDCQSQSLKEFAASDNPSRLAPEAGPMEFFVGKGEVIKGIEFAVCRMKVGQTVRVVVTPQLAYGQVGLPGEGGVPPNSIVVYDLTLDAFGSGSGSAGGSGGASRSAAESDDVVPPPPPMPIDDGIVMAKPGSKPQPKPAKPAISQQKPSGYERSRADSKPNNEYQSANSPAALPSPRGQPQAQGSGRNGFVPPKGKDVSLADAIAIRREKLDTGGGAGNAVMRPVQERPVRNNKPNQGYAGRDRVEVQKNDNKGARPQGRAPPSNQGGGGSAPAERRDGPKTLYTLKQLQEFVRDKRLDQLNIDSEYIEDWMEDSEFEKAFQMSRNDFLLKPRWRQQALKRGLRLF